MPEVIGTALDSPACADPGRDTWHLERPISTPGGGYPGGSWERSQTRRLKRKESEAVKPGKELRGEQHVPESSKPLTVRIYAERCFVCLFWKK